MPKSKQQKRQEAEERTAEREKLTIAQKLQNLEFAPGDSYRERMRLEAKLTRGEK